jgi:malate dehydrogenase (oxaloacetate-decarboxylating)
MSAINVTGVPLTEQRVVIVGLGTAGLGIVNLLVQFMVDAGLSEAEARRRFYGIDRCGLVTESDPELRPEQRPYARSDDEVRSWRAGGREITLLDVVRHARPTVLIGVSGQKSAFSMDAIREMARHAERPVIFPLSNPTSRSEATPQDLMDWTDGRALVGTGSPFGRVTSGGRTMAIAQTNNSYIFPGLALGIVASRATRVTDAMIKAAAMELVRHLPTRTDKTASLLPPLSDARRLGRAIGEAVGKQALRDGQARVADEAALARAIETNIWSPVYVPYEQA